MKVVWPVSSGRVVCIPAVLTLKSKALPPTTLTSEMVRGAVPWFLMVKVFSKLGMPSI